jgi:hypothetical protein
MQKIEGKKRGVECEKGKQVRMFVLDQDEGER